MLSSPPTSRDCPLRAGYDLANNRKLVLSCRRRRPVRRRSMTSAPKGMIEVPIGFSADDQIAYLRVEQDEGPDAIVAVDSRRTNGRSCSATPTATEIGHHRPETDTRRPCRCVLHRRQAAHRVLRGRECARSRLYRSLESAFAGDAVRIVSKTADSKLALVQASSDRNPGDFYFYDTVAKKAELVLSRRDWFDPARWRKNGRSRSPRATACLARLHHLAAGRGGTNTCRW